MPELQKVELDTFDKMDPQTIRICHQHIKLDQCIYWLKFMEMCIECCLLLIGADLYFHSGGDCPTLILIGLPFVCAPFSFFNWRFLHKSGRSGISSKNFEISLLIVIATLHGITALSIFYLAEIFPHIGPLLMAIYWCIAEGLQILTREGDKTLKSAAGQTRNKENDKKIVDAIICSRIDGCNNVLSNTEIIALINIGQEVDKIKQQVVSSDIKIDGREEKPLLELLRYIREPQYQMSESAKSMVKKMINDIINIALKERIIVYKFFGKYSDRRYHGRPTRKELYALCHVLQAVEKESTSQQFREDIAEEEDIIPSEVARQYMYNPILYRRGFPQMLLSEKQWTEFKTFFMDVVDKAKNDRADIYYFFGHLMNKDCNCIASEEITITLKAFLQEIEAKLDSGELKDDYDATAEATTPFEVGRRYIWAFNYEPAVKELLSLRDMLRDLVEDEGPIPLIANCGDFDAMRAI